MSYRGGVALFENRHRAMSFGSDAERYDRTRPSYPPALVDRLADDGSGDAVDIGCGTGLLARLLEDRRWNVIGVEADDRMAAVAASHGLRVDVARFEEWDVGTRRFDLLTSAQAWHWIDPEIGYRKAAEVLRSGGRIALIWIAYTYEPAIVRTIADVLERHAPDLLVDSVIFGSADPDHARSDLAALECAADWFETPAVEAFEHERTLTVDEWIAELPTHSQLATMSPDALRAVTGEFTQELRRIAPHGLRVRHPVHMATAVRR